MPHTGRLVLITGPASGIGRATALRFAREGARLALFDLQSAVEQTAADARSFGAEARAWVVDVSDGTAVDTAVTQVCATLGEIACLVNGAGIVDHIAPLAKMKPEAWAREISVNLGGPFNLVRAVAPGMADRGWGRIVNISSAAARGGLSLQAGYVASKAGLLGLTRNVALEFGRDGLTCNAILPGLIETEKVQAMPRGILEAGIAATPARRLGTMEEVAALISFLCSDDAGYINGAEIDISGGSHLNTLVLGSQRENRDKGV
jgi:NAD(P)-dependent dehydrogenase (short-subunit alcohol dehydrogenase family)